MGDEIGVDIYLNAESKMDLGIEKFVAEENLFAINNALREQNHLTDF